MEKIIINNKKELRAAIKAAIAVSGIGLTTKRNADMFTMSK